MDDIGILAVDGEIAGGGEGTAENGIAATSERDVFVGIADRVCRHVNDRGGQVVTVGTVDLQLIRT